MRRAVPFLTRCSRTARSWRTERKPMPPPPRPPPMAWPRILMGATYRRRLQPLVRPLRTGRVVGDQAAVTRRRIRVTTRKAKANSARTPTMVAMTADPLSVSPDETALAPAPAETWLTSWAWRMPERSRVLAEATAEPAARVQITAANVAVPSANRALALAIVI